MMGEGCLYGRLFWEEIKRKAWAAALLGLALFFALPVAMAMELSSYQPDESVNVTLADVIERRVKSAQMILGFADGDYPLVMLILLVTAVVLGITAFSYLHDKKQVDLYHSLPVKRDFLFVVRLGVGIAIVGTLYLFFILLSFAVARANGVMLAQVLPAAIRGFFLNLLYYTLVYSTVVLAMMMTGTRLAAVLGTAVFFGYLPMLSGLVMSFYDEFFSTFYYGVPTIWTGILSKISPITALFLVMSDGVTLGRVLWALASSLLLFFASWLLYRKRPLEAAGRTMVFGWSKGPIKVLLTVAFGMAGALFFYSIEDDLGWMVFGALVGTVVSHCVIEVVYHGDFKKLFCHKRTMAACMVFGLAVSISFYFDLFRYDTYVPEEGQVAYASVDFALDTWVDHGVIKGEDGYLQPKVEDILENARIADMGAVLGLAREGIRQLGLQESEATDALYGSEVSSWKEAYATKTWIVVCYTLKSGRKVYRTYSIWLDPVMELADQLYTDPAYKAALFPGLCLDVKEAAKNAVYREMGGSVQTVQKDLEKWQAVVEAYREEFTRLTLTDRTCEGPVGELLLISDQDDQYVQEDIQKSKIYIEEQVYRYSSVWYDGYFYPVYPSFTKTIQALSDCGITVGASLAPERFYKIQITSYGTAEEDHMLDPAVITYTDPEQIKAILAAYIFDDSRRKNGMILRDGQYDIELHLKERDLSSSKILSGKFLKGKIPAFVLKDFEEIWKEEKASQPKAGESF